MPKVFSKKPMISDVLKWESDFKYGRESMKVTAGATDVTVGVGECYVKSTGTKFTGASEAIPAAWNVTLGGDFTAAAIPEVYTIRIGGTWAANDTLEIGATTFTAKATPTTTSTGNEFSAGGTGTVICEDLKACGLAVTGFTITYSGDTITLTQTVPGTGDSPTLTPTSTAGTATLANTQNYRAADSISWGGTSVAVVASGATGNQVNAGTLAQIASQLAALTLSGFNVTANGNVLSCTQSTASSIETAPVVTVSSESGTVKIEKSQSYVAAADTDFDCIVLENHVIPAGATYEVLVLARGPATVDIDRISAGSNTKEATAARLAELNIKAVFEPDFVHYQTT